mmetsp:Transcript_6467/g.8125  ORF Transcript_6467/g.8125 Transcript_6467/m.8125 type:complete len:309 (-) Transcript_6467:148-1074(-)
MTIRRASASNVSTAKQWLCQNHSTCTESMTFSESLENLITVSSICPRKLNNILNPVAMRPRGASSRWSRKMPRHSCSLVGCAGTDGSDDCNFSAHLSCAQSASNQSKSSQKHGTNYKSVFENDSRFCEVDGFINLANKDDRCKQGSIFNGHIEVCKSFLNRFDYRKHSSGETSLHTRSSQYRILDTVPARRRYSNPEIRRLRNKDSSTVQRFISFLEKEAPVDDSIGTLSSICEKGTVQNDSSVDRESILRHSKTTRSSYLSRQTSLEKAGLRDNNQSIWNGFSLYPRFFIPVLADRRKGEVDETRNF